VTRVGSGPQPGGGASAGGQASVQRQRTAALSRWIAEATATPLDDEVRARASLHLLDTLAAIVACRDLEAAQVARRYVAGRRGPGASSPGATEATILGTREVAPLADAVFAGAMTGHAAELNDFVPSVFVQPGPSIVATAVGVGEATGASGEAMLRALVAGYELAVRMPRALGTANLRRAGIANHGVGPCFGVAATASALLGLPAASIADVLSAVAQQAAGSWQWLLDVDHIEKAFVFAGMGARNGLDAALLVAAGYRGVPDVLDRPGTFFTSGPFADPAGDADLDGLVRDLDRPTAFELAAIKRYPVGGPTQPAVEALLDLVAHDVGAPNVASVVIELPGRWEAFRDAAMPALNLPYLTAVVLLDGRLDVVAAQSLERMHGDREVAELMARVEVRHDPDQEPPPGAERTESARVTLTLADGTIHRRFVPHVVGYPSHPMPAADVEGKARALVEPHLGRARTDALVDACRHVADHDAAAFAALVAR
jgi:2-methylcitrate dehydratase PrpD